MKTKDDKNKGKLSFYCKALDVSRQAFYDYLEMSEKPWKYEALAAEMLEIRKEDECNDTYGSVRMWQALTGRHTNEKIPSEPTIRRIMDKIGIIHKRKRKPNGITKADKEAMKSDDLLKRDFKADMPCVKAVTDITEIPTAEGKLYVSVAFDCFDLMPLGIAMANNMRAELCVKTLENACKKYPELKGAIVHSDRGSQYTSTLYRKAISDFGLVQSMNSAGGRCHDNARCESMWGRMKEELLYGRYDTKKMGIEEVKTLIWRYYMSYWSNRRICSANGGLTPAEKRRRYYEEHQMAA